MGKDIKIFFDKNTWSDVAKLSENERQQLTDGVKKAQESYGLIIHFTPVNVFELLKSVKDDDTFKLCQAELKIAAPLTNVHLLEHPWDHVKRGTVELVTIEPLSLDKSFLQLMRIIVKATSYPGVEPLVTELRSKIINFQKDWLVLTQETIQKIKEKAESDKLDIRKLISPDNRPGRIKELWRSFQQHFRLQEPEFTKLDWSEVYSKLPSFRYWSQIQIRYMDRLIIIGYQPKESDYFDIEQTVYFDIMDYLISDDKKLRTLLEETKKPELQGRILTVEEFRQNILTLKKRAVNNSSSKWVELSEKT